MQATNRLLALDVMRGITIAGMIMVNNPGSWGHIFTPLEHGVKVIAGMNAEKGEFIQQYSKGFGLMDDSKGEIGLVTNSSAPIITSTSATYGPAHNWWSVAGYFGRINYDYDNKYLVELDGRYDGSSNFPVSGRWAFFPSASLGWRVTEEPFMKEAKKVITDLKLRASYGTIGNQDVNQSGQNLFLSTMGK